MKDIVRVARAVGLRQDELERYGDYAAKIRPAALRRLSRRPAGTLILVTAMTPLPEGEGKTTISIGLCDALNRLGRKAIVTLRQPSLGITLGRKGGGSGGGRSSVEPADEINLHFTGDTHAVAYAHDQLAAWVDNEVYYGNPPGIDPHRIVWPRTLDVEDRTLRDVSLHIRDVAYREGFVITPASEIMSILTLARDEKDLQQRLGAIIVAYRRNGKPVTAADLGHAATLAMLLRKAFWPNLVQTQEGNAAIVHGGAFANVSVGTNSLRAIRLALNAVGSDGFAVTETGFGSELGLEKFVDIVARSGRLRPGVAVIVVTLKAIRQQGMENLRKHVENVRSFGLAPVVAINRFRGDSVRELNTIRANLGHAGIRVAITDAFNRGGEGALGLAREVMDAAEETQTGRPRAGRPGTSKLRFTYSLNDPLALKIEKIATGVYGAIGVRYASAARRRLRELEKFCRGWPVCMAKTPLSLSDRKELTGRPKGFQVTVTGMEPLAGAGLVLVKLGPVLLMPGMPESAGRG